MSKKNRKKNNNQSDLVNRGTPRVSLRPEVNKVKAALESANDVGIAVTIEFDETLAIKFQEALPEQATEMKSWLNKFSEIAGQVKSKSHALEQGEVELEEKRLKIRAQEEEAILKKAELRKIQDDFEPQASKLEELRADLVNREKNILSREDDARNKFGKLNDELLNNLKSEKSELESDLADLKREIQATKLCLTDTLQEKSNELDQKRMDFSAKENALSRKEAQLDRSIIDNESEAERLKQDFRERLLQKEERFEKQLERERNVAEKALNAKDDMRRLLRDYEDFERMLGGQSTDYFIEQFDNLKRKNQQLESQISTSGHTQMVQENNALKQRVDALQSRLRDVEPDYEQVKSELSRHRIASTEKQQLVAEKKVLEKHKQVLDAHVNDLESRIDNLAESQQAQNPFPALSQMDKDDRYQINPQLDEVPDLKQFAPELRRRIAYAEKEVVLHYRLEDIQLLLGGLAMSQLHVFQGISGTGKTSLAKAFAKAMGGDCTDISVQAGWRDKDDLLGHYNAFEKRFYEKECLQGLYLAQTPAYADRCNVILLDEMNLSRPEQYFSEFLSKLEINSPDERLITMSESELSHAPRQWTDGRKIRVPKNIWFMGTANQDETTNELADKTYDRAHVMVLPKHEAEGSIERIQPQKFSYASLQSRFTNAQKTHKAAVVELLEEVRTSDLTTILEQRFELGWGNRFERQAMEFIPVVMAAGGAREMALDHLLSTRILRNGKVVGRYDTQEEDLTTLQESLNKLWKAWDGEPDKCNALLGRDISRKAGLA